MKQRLIQRLEDNLKGCEFQMSNGSITHFVYPCRKCGGIMYHLYTNDNLILSIEIADIESLDIARRVFNLKSANPPMTKGNFVDFLILLKAISLQENSQLN